MGQTREQKIIKQLSGGQVQKQTPIATDMFLPNHSGDHSAGIVRATPTADLDIVNKKYVDDEIAGIGAGTSIPTGTIAMFGSTTAPTGWVMCDGYGYNTTTYPDLFAVIGFSFGGGGSIFNVPNFSERFPLGYSPLSIGASGGNFDHTHTLNELSTSHSHGAGSLTYGDHTHSLVCDGHTHIGTTDNGNADVSDSGHTHTGTTDGHGHSTNNACIDNPSQGFYDQSATDTFTTDSGNANVSDNGHNHTFTSATGTETGLTDMSGGGGVGGNTDSGGIVGGSTNASNPPYLCVSFIIKT